MTASTSLGHVTALSFPDPEHNRKKNCYGVVEKLIETIKMALLVKCSLFDAFVDNNSKSEMYGVYAFYLLSYK